jgi:hypothetical protein
VFCTGAKDCEKRPSKKRGSRSYQLVRVNNRRRGRYRVVTESVAAPRDNVIFEMGLFMEAKGRERVLVVREEGAKMPADIGGGIYLSLKDRNDITPIQMKLLDFVQKRI